MVIFHKTLSILKEFAERRIIFKYNKKAYYLIFLK